MAKDLTAPELLKGVDGWLQKQGYPLEMRVAAKLESHGFNAQQSYYYRLPTDEEHREMDVMAFHPLEHDGFRWQPSSRRTDRKPRPDSPAYGADIVLTVECKSGSADTPWLVFTSRRLHEEAFPDRYAQTKLATSTLAALRRSGEKLTLFPKGSEYGHSVVEANLNGAKPRRDDGYDLAHAATIKIATARTAMLGPPELGDHLFRLVIPVVVISMPLVLCSLEDGRTKLSERSDLIVGYVRGDLSQRAAKIDQALVHIVREDALDDFISRVKKVIGDLQRCSDVIIESAGKLQEAKRTRAARGRT